MRVSTRRREPTVLTETDPFEPVGVLGRGSVEHAELELDRFHNGRYRNYAQIEQVGTIGVVVRCGPVEWGLASSFAAWSARWYRA